MNEKLKLDMDHQGPWELESDVLMYAMEVNREKKSQSHCLDFQKSNGWRTKKRAFG